MRKTVACIAIFCRRTEACKGVCVSDGEKVEMDELMIIELVKKGQILPHIYAKYESEMSACLRLDYNHVDNVNEQNKYSQVYAKDS